MGYASAALLIYFLSIGPAAKLYAVLQMKSKYPRTEKAIEAIYAPFGVLVKHYPPAGRLLIWYVEGIWRVPAD